MYNENNKYLWNSNTYWNQDITINKTSFKIIPPNCFWSGVEENTLSTISNQTNETLLIYPKFNFLAQLNPLQYIPRKPLVPGLESIWDMYHKGCISS